MIKNNNLQLILSGMMVALIAVFAQIMIPIGPVPISLQVMGVFLTGFILKPKYALLASASYILLGMIGVPVFTAFRSGLGYIAGPTGGFLLVFILMSWTISFILNAWGRKIWTYIFSGVIAVIQCYTVGTLWFLFIGAKGMSLMQALYITVIPFIPFEIIKLAGAVIIAAPVYKILEKKNL